MKTGILGGVIAATVLLICSAAGAVPEINSDRPTDTPFMGDAPEKDPEIRILEAKDILLLNDQKLLEAYIDVLVELDATKTFHSTSGFMPKEFKKYKSLLKYRLQLFFEIHRRKMDIPAEIK